MPRDERRRKFLSAAVASSIRWMCCVHPKSRSHIRKIGNFSDHCPSLDSSDSACYSGLGSRRAVTTDAINRLGLPAEAKGLLNAMPIAYAVTSSAPSGRHRWTS